MMKKLAILILLMTHLGFGQSNPKLDLAIESERIKALRGKPTIQIGLTMHESGDLAGVKRNALLEQLETYLHDAGIPYASAKDGIRLQNDTLAIDFRVTALPFLQTPLITYFVRVSLLELATTARQPDYRKAVPVWEADDFGLGSSSDAAVQMLLSLMQQFATDYLRANPELQLKQ